MCGIKGAMGEITYLYNYILVDKKSVWVSGFLGFRVRSCQITAVLVGSLYYDLYIL